MVQFWMTCNGVASLCDAPRGHMAEFAVSASAGSSTIVAWCMESALSLALVAPQSNEIVDEQWGHVVSSTIELSSPASVIVRIGVERRVLSAADEALVEKAEHILTAETASLDVDSTAALLKHASRLTSSVATFLAECDEFCVVRRRMVASAKKIPIPCLASRANVAQIMVELQRGEPSWKQSSGSFSTMMRFIQRSKDTFQWAEENERAETQLSTIIIT